MSRRGSSVAELRRLGGLESALKIVQTGTSSDARESAALVLANSSQQDDEVCKRVVDLPQEVLAELVGHLKSTNAIVKKSVARTIANCTAAEFEDGSSASAALLAAGAVAALLDVVPCKDLALMRSVTSALDNLCQDSTAVCAEAFRVGALDCLVSILVRPEWPTDDIVNESIASCLGSLVASSEAAAAMAAENGAVRCMYEAVKPLADAAVARREMETTGESVDDPATPPAQREPTDVEELAFTMITTALKMSPAAVFALYQLDATFSLLRNMLASPVDEVQVQAMAAIECCALAAVQGPDGLGVAGAGTATAAAPAAVEGEEKKADPEGGAVADGVAGGAGGGAAAPAAATAGGGKGFSGPSFTASLAADKKAAAAADDRLPRVQVLEAVYTHISVTLTWMLDHTTDEVATIARRTFTVLRRGAGEGSTVTAATLRPFLGSGVVPVLQTLLGSENEATSAYCEECLVWLKEACTPEVLAGIKSDIATVESLDLRTSLAVALTYLCFDSEPIQKGFLVDDGLGNVLRMLSLPSKRPAAINYLLAVQPIIDPGDDEDEDEDDDGTIPPVAGPWSEDHVNNEEDSDVMLLLGEAKKKLYLHKTVLRDHSEVVSGMRMAQRDNIEVPEVSFETAEITMKAIYKGDLEAIWERARAPDATFAVEVMRLGHSLGMAVLTKFVSARLLDSIDEASIVPIFREALACADTRLCGACVNFVLENASWLFERGDKAEPLAELLRQLIAGMIEE